MVLQIKRDSLGYRHRLRPFSGPFSKLGVLSSRRRDDSEEEPKKKTVTKKKEAAPEIDRWHSQWNVLIKYIHAVHYLLVTSKNTVKICKNISNIF